MGADGVAQRKSPAEDAAAIRNCLAYLAAEARAAGFGELARLLDLARLAAAELSSRTVN